jgi:hypothetical protein
MEGANGDGGLFAHSQSNPPSNILWVRNGPRQLPPPLRPGICPLLRAANPLDLVGGRTVKHRGNLPGHPFLPFTVPLKVVVVGVDWKE